MFNYPVKLERDDKTGAYVVSSATYHCLIPWVTHLKKRCLRLVMDWSQRLRLRLKNADLFPLVASQKKVSTLSLCQCYQQ